MSGHRSVMHGYVCFALLKAAETATTQHLHCSAGFMPGGKTILRQLHTIKLLSVAFLLTIRATVGDDLLQACKEQRSTGSDSNAIFYFYVNFLLLCALRNRVYFKKPLICERYGRLKIKGFTVYSNSTLEQLPAPPAVRNGRVAGLGVCIIYYWEFRPPVPSMRFY